MLTTPPPEAEWSREMKNQPKKYAAFDTQAITLEMLGLLGRAIVAGIAVSVTAVLFVVVATAAA